MSSFSSFKSYNICLDISGSSVDNCIPMANWLTSGSSNVTMRFISDDENTSSGVDIIAKCVPDTNANSYTWLNRRNLFGLNDLCYTCDLRLL